MNTTPICSPESVFKQNVRFKERGFSSTSRNKPYKVLRNSEIKLIDFGGATYNSDRDDYTINTRQYRAPEVVLGCCNWSYPSDVWSIGCIFMELYTGELFFPTHNNVEHLMLIEKACFRVPSWMVKGAKKNLQKYYDDEKREFAAEGHPDRHKIEKNVKEFENFKVLA